MPSIRLPELSSPSIYDLLPPHRAITDSDHGGYVVIAGWVMMCFFFLSVFARILTRFIPVRVYGTDDIVIGLSTICGIAQTAAIHVSASNGLGQHIHTLPYTSYEVFARAYYASDLLFIVTIYLAKISLVLFIMRLTPSHKTLYFCYAFVTTQTLWMLGTVFSLAFQCPLPQPWLFMPLRSANCVVNITGVYYSIGAIDILSDLIIIATPAVIVRNVQISRRQRFTVIGVFSIRLVVCICSGLFLVSLPAFIRSSDRTWEAVTPQIWRQVVQCLSIITACIPALRPFLASLESGFMDSSMDGVIGRTYGGLSGQSSSKTKGPESLALTSFAAGGRRAIIIPRILNKNLEDGSNKSRALASGAVCPAGSFLSPRSQALAEQQDLGTLNESSTVSSMSHDHPFKRISSTTGITSGSRRVFNKPSPSYHARGERSTDSIDMTASQSCRSLHKNMQTGSMGEGCIRETREVVISVEHEGLRLLEGGLYPHGSTTCLTPLREQRFIREHSSQCSS